MRKTFPCDIIGSEKAVPPIPIPERYLSNCAGLGFGDGKVWIVNLTEYALDENGDYIKEENGFYVQSTTQVDQYASLENLLANSGLYTEVQEADKLEADYAIARDSGGIVHVGSTDDGVYYKWKHIDKPSESGTEAACFDKADDTFIVRKYYKRNF